jgi:hypothetical protein
MWNFIIERGLGIAGGALALAAQLSGYTNMAIALALVGVALFFGLAPVCHHCRKLHLSRKEAGLRTVEPSHLIIVGLSGVIVFAALALAGVIWQHQRGPIPRHQSQADIEKAKEPLYAQINSLKQQLDEAQREKLPAPPPAQTQQRARLLAPMRDGPVEWNTTFFGWNETNEGDLLVGVLMTGGTNRSAEPLTNLSAYFTPNNTAVRMRAMIVGDRGEHLDPKNTHGIPPGADFRFFVKVPSSNPQYPQGISADEYLAKYGGYKFEMEYNEGPVRSTASRDLLFAEAKELVQAEQQRRLARKREQAGPGIRGRN